MDLWRVYVQTLLGMPYCAGFRQKAPFTVWRICQQIAQLFPHDRALFSGISECVGSLQVLSGDRYMAACVPSKSIRPVIPKSQTLSRSRHFRMRTNSVAISVLASCTFVATLLLYPVLKESTVLRVNKLTGLRLLEEQEELDAAAEQGEIPSN